MQISKKPLVFVMFDIQFICLFALLWQFAVVQLVSCTNASLSKQQNIAAGNDKNSDQHSYAIMVPFLHKTCRNCIYPRSNVKRFTVPDHLISWTEQFAEYLPEFYESPNLVGKPYADPQIGKHPNLTTYDSYI